MAERGATRGGGDSKPLSAVLEARKNWIDFSFTPLCIWLGKVAAPVCLARLVIFRQDEEAYALSLLVGATFQYVVFKEGADVHIFWPHYFAPYFALALAQLAGTVGAVVARVLRWFSAPLVRSGALRPWGRSGLRVVGPSAGARHGARRRVLARGVAADGRTLR